MSRFVSAIWKGSLAGKKSYNKAVLARSLRCETPSNVEKKIIGVDESKVEAQLATQLGKTSPL